MAVPFITDAAAAAVGRQQISTTDAQKIEQVAASAVNVAQSMQALGGVPDIFEVIGNSAQVKQLSKAERAVFDKVFGEMLSNVSAAFSAAAASRLSPPVAVAKPLDPDRLFMSHLPNDIQDRMDQALLDMFSSNNGVINGLINPGWTVTATYHFAMIGLSDAEIGSRVHEKLTKHFANLDKHGLPPRPEFGAQLHAKLLSGSLQHPRSDAKDISEMFGLGQVGRAMDAAGMKTGYDLNLAGYEMADGYRLAARFNLQGDAEQCLANLARRNDVNEAARALEEAGAGDIPMMNIAAIAVEQYLRDGHHNTAWGAVEALKRVQGDLKPAASQMLKELAKKLFETNEGTDRDLAFKALRARGVVIDKKAEDSVKVDFLTTVTGEVERADIISFARKALAEDGPWNGYSDEMIKALEACQAYEVISEIGKAMLRDVGHASVRMPLIMWKYTRTAEVFARAFDKQGLEALVERAEIDDRLSVNQDGGTRWTMLDQLKQQTENTKWAVSRGPITPVRNEKAFSTPSRMKGFLQAQKELEAGLHSDLKSAVAKSPEERRALRREAKGFMVRGRLWDAQGKFMEAADRAGILRACDAMIQAGDGLNAPRGLLTAAMLEA